MVHFVIIPDQNDNFLPFSFVPTKNITLYYTRIGLIKVAAVAYCYAIKPVPPIASSLAPSLILSDNYPYTRQGRGPGRRKIFGRLCRRLRRCSGNSIIIGWKYGGARQLFRQENAIRHVISYGQGSLSATGPGRSPGMMQLCNDGGSFRNRGGYWEIQ